MKQKKDFLQLSASDLSNFLSCSHSTQLDKKVVRGELKKPEWKNPHTKVLQERGFQHEEDYIEHLKNKGLEVTEIAECESSTDAYTRTMDAMKLGADIIIQGVLKIDNWFGRLDILRKVEHPSNLGDFSYEVIDTKLSRETKAGTILQLCLYSEMVEDVQGIKPENMFVVTPGENFVELKYRVEDYQSYYRLVRTKLIEALDNEEESYPDPVMYCDICKWFEVCNERRRNDDHLTFVAGLSSSQIKDLSTVGITTLEGLANANEDFYVEIDGANSETMLRIKEQARMQLMARESGRPGYELLSLAQERGLNRLPLPTEGDIFFDLEGDQYYKEAGIEYLWGFSHVKDGNLEYEHKWAMNYREERECFEWFIDHVIKQKKTYPNLKIYHYSSYEPGALKRLMGRYGVKESEIDHLLRTESFVDLYSITRQSIRAGIEKYSIKDLEQFYEFTRAADLRDVGPHKRHVEHALELGRELDIREEAKEVVKMYNKDDTDSTYYLREWLEELRRRLEKEGESLSRPEEIDGEISEELDEHLQRLMELRDSLQEGISPLEEERSQKENSQWLLGDLIGFFRREDKVNFWEKYRLKDLDALELLEDKSGISGLNFIETVGGTEKCRIDRYSFSDQVIDIKKGAQVFKEGFLRDEEVKNFGAIEDIDLDSKTIDIKKKGGFASFHPNAIWAWRHFNKRDQEDRVIELAEFVLENSIDSDDPLYKAALDILLHKNPDIRENCENSEALERAKNMALNLDNSFLAIQGPPGTGKSFSASRVALKLIEAGYRIGVTGQSHKVISNLMDKIAEAAQKMKVNVNLYRKPGSEEKVEDGDILHIGKSLKLSTVLNSSEPFILGGTIFMWAKEDMRNTVDYLLVDEAGQFSLVGILSAIHATNNLILLGDGAQLKQPIQGSHPDGCEVSALDYIVGDHKILPSDKGVFLPITYRLHPDICRFNSELFYDNELNAIKENECQVIKGDTEFSNKSLALVEVDHWGNTNYSPEEVDKVVELVNELVVGNNTYTIFKDGSEITEKVDFNSIKIISPYNAQVNRIKQALPDVSVGTVDKFQGQEAPIIIYSVATSSPEDAPRGMDFLYSGNRLNVAVSRAECLFIMVANKKIFEPNCKSPAQMKLANSYCRFVEMVNEKGKTL